jgi:hypothetical protein
LGETLNPTSPLPLPGVPEFMMMKDEFDVAVHAHPEGALTATLLLPPPEPNERKVGVIVNMQPLPVPVWFTVNGRPAIVIVPLLDDTPVFAVTEKLIEPLPVPPAGPLIVMKGALLVAVQTHPDVVDTSTLPVPPEEPNVWLVGDMLNVHPRPAWFIAKSLPPTITYPTLASEPGFEATLNFILPEPVPPETGSVTKESRLVALQLQPEGAVMLISPEPPLELKEELEGDMELRQDAPA